MDAKLKGKLVKALRSGKYKKGASALYSEGHHCCLGVLARVQGAIVGGGCLKIAGKDVRAGKGDPENKTEYLAKEYAAGLHTKTQKRLAEMNDGRGIHMGKPKSFKQIADFIEKRL